MNRKLALLAVALLLGGTILIYKIWAGWGLITIHAQAQPLSKIVSAIRSQGHVTLKTDLPLDTPVSMDVDRVPVSEALETLATVTEGRWRLTYFLAPDKSAIQSALGSIESGQRPDGWKQIFHPMPSFVATSEDAVMPDPRKGVWTVQAPETNTLQAYLDDAAKAVNVAFSVPESFNPTIKSTPKNGEIARVIPKLSSAAGGKIEEVFLLTKGGQRGPRPEGEQRPDFAALPNGGGDGQPRGNFGGGRMNSDAMERRMQNEINQLPAAERATALADFQKERDFWKSLQDLPQDQRQQKMQDHMNDPEVQARMEARQNRQDSRRTPQQRIQRDQKYVANKMQAKQPKPAQ